MRSIATALSMSADDDQVLTDGGSSGSSIAFAAERDLSLLQVAIGGLAAMPTVGSVIAGATSVDQVQQNVAAGSWQPSGEDLTALMEITGGGQPKP